MRILVLGAGGIGGYFGGRLVQAGRDVTFLVRPARAERLQAEGLRIESLLGDAVIPVTTRTEAAGPYDLVVLSCKAYDLGASIDALGDAVGEGTLVLPLLNGLAHYDRLDAAFGAARVLGGIAFISAALAVDGRVRHLGKPAVLTLGARQPEQAEACERVAAALTVDRFALRRSEAIAQDAWEKFAFITAAASITCLMRAPVGDILRADDGERLTLAMIAEAEAVAAASGFPVRARAQAIARNVLTEAGSRFTASMLRDLEAGGRVEADHLQGDMIRRAEAHGLDVPLTRAAYAQLQAHASRRS